MQLMHTCTPHTPALACRTPPIPKNIIGTAFLMRRSTDTVGPHSVSTSVMAFHHYSAPFSKLEERSIFEAEAERYLYEAGEHDVLLKACMAEEAMDKATSRGEFPAILSAWFSLCCSKYHMSKISRRPGMKSESPHARHQARPCLPG